MNPKLLFLAACILLCCGSLNAQFAPDSFQGVVLHSVPTSAPPPYDFTLGKTHVSVMSRSAMTYSTYVEGLDQVAQTGVSYSYAKESANVGVFKVWIDSIQEYATTYYTFTSHDSGTVRSVAPSIGTVEGTFKLYKTWSWQDQVDYWDQATVAQNAYILADPSRLGLYNQAQLNTAVSQAKVGLYTQTQLDQAIVVAKAGLYTQSELDAAVDAAETNAYFKTSEGWALSDNATPSFSLSIKRSTDLENWETAGEAEVQFSGDGTPAFLKVELE